MKKGLGVDNLLCLLLISYITKYLLVHVIISNVPAVNTINKCNVFVMQIQHTIIREIFKVKKFLWVPLTHEN